MSSASGTQVFRIHIKATPEQIWDAITKPEWTQRYGYGGLAEYDLRPGGVARQSSSDAMRKAGADKGWPVPDVIVDGEVIEADPPRRLVQTWRMLMDPAVEAEGFTRLTYEIEPDPARGVSRLTVTHELEGKPQLTLMVTGESVMAGGGWPWILSDLKTLLETGSPIVGGEWLEQS